MGHRALAIDLPGLGDDPAPPESVSFRDWIARVGDALDRCASPAVLVGHSMGGLAISAMAERRPESIRRLVYVAALLPASGQSAADIEDENPDPRIPQHTTRSPDGKLLSLAAGSLRELLYHDCPPEIAAEAGRRLRPQSFETLLTSVRLRPGRFGQVPRTYIECTEDGAICLALQRRMQANWPGTEVVSIKSGHSPFFSAPEELAALLSQAASS